MKSSDPRKGIRWKVGFAIVAACLVGFGAGWFTKDFTIRESLSLPLRLDGYQFISPLLSCNNAKSFPQDQQMTNAIQAAVSADESVGAVTNVSTYFADFETGQWSVTGQNEKYYPSSLGKIPIMMAYYELAESSSAILDQKITYPLGSPDLNATQDIKPAKAIVPGQTYSVEQLIEYMIEDSDNNAAALLTQNIDQNALTNVYDDLQIPIDNDVTITNANFITPQQISTLFKVLYNATYLSRDYSEQALKLMSQSSFTQGLVAGVPSSTVVAHKLGLVGISENGVTTGHELHDCGIVYGKPNSYLLCVMTSGSSSLPAMEGAIADISQTVYQQAEAN